MPAAFAASRFLVLPSTFEPWGVVVHEAVASGLGVICTDKVGAGDYLVEDRCNGRVLPAADAGSLRDAMVWAHDRTPPELGDVRSRSLELAARYSPDRWAATVRDIGERLGGPARVGSGS